MFFLVWFILWNFLLFESVFCKNLKCCKSIFQNIWFSDANFFSTCIWRDSNRYLKCLSYYSKIIEYDFKSKRVFYFQINKIEFLKRNEKNRLKNFAKNSNVRIPHNLYKKQDSIYYSWLKDWKWILIIN